mmetsp:Transcript_9814/g.9911  ORF Transcript_9814/g.9911 Transcript_9814/m.9911 type:complete len:939 (+) Transcript_9814:116-2932(+)|eukprot:CAMPEP_0182418176 /NCGR_PEP_ID=MMETSP1167-20130531/2645_1 /TAXON_ID=2988 /ORGANISM="Mallomonas Sp, Strain CCMP3275" /LENGTH=938 /DNA_ID=CAMNT_0024592233 /DNA_START=20 /DNA_END=2836 /DNA_ORIENTATION=-
MLKNSLTYGRAVRWSKPVRAFPSLRSLSSLSQAKYDQKLRDEVRMLGSILGEYIKGYDPKVFDAVENIRRLGREYRKANDDPAIFEQMVAEIKSWDANMIYGVSRSFSTFLALENSAENSNKIRSLKDDLVKSGTSLGLLPKNDSCGGTIDRLVNVDKVPAQTIYDALLKQHVEIVLTAHPTEVNRRTMLHKHHRISEILTELDSSNLPSYDRKQYMRELRGEIASMWASDDLRRTKPSPVDEAKAGLQIVEKVLWKAIPNFLRKLDDVLSSHTGLKLPLHISPLKMASWMGGDRDGNPNVTAGITLEVSMLSRRMAATLLRKDIQNLIGTLSQRLCSDEFRELSGDAREPYRHVLAQIDARLEATIDWAQTYVKTDTIPPVAVNKQSVKEVPPYKRSHEIMEPLLAIHKSLVKTGQAEVADGELADTIRCIAGFGMCLLPLDIRQESGRHAEALDAITRHLGIGSYLHWDEATRRNWLQSELSSKRPLLPRHKDIRNFGFSDTVTDTLTTFELISALDEESLGAYVISQCQQTSDILAVMLLQQDAGVSPLIPVVPLFETLDDLERSASTVNSLFEMSAYKGRINGKQQIMVGYSDSAKDAGRIAAYWAQHHAQVDMIKVAEKHGIEVTFFHGKGGTVGRGGNPAVYDAILAHPPHTVNGRFRVTEQGEMITRNFGKVAVAERSLDLFTAGVLAETFALRPEVQPGWYVTMDRLAATSCAAYRKVVREEPRFVPYFRSATPEQDLSGLNVGSRPAKRNPKGGVESLRAIPWIFAWTQTRLHLPAWLGVGDALAEEMKTNPEVVKQMYTDWPWFRTMIDLLEMILVKADSKIAENYDIQLVNDPESLALGQELREKLKLTTQTILEVSGHPHLQSSNPSLLASLGVRNPYLDPLNILQAELLKRLRSENQYSDEETVVMRDALLITINGIVAGLRNSG